MKRQSGNNWRIFLTLIVVVALCSCKEDTYTTKITYENTLQQSLRIEFYQNYHTEKADKVLYLAPNGSTSTQITVFNSEDVFEYTQNIRLVFEDSKSVLYQKQHAQASQTNLMSKLNYTYSKDQMNMKITSAHYNEASGDRRGRSPISTK